MAIKLCKLAAHLLDRDFFGACKGMVQQAEGIQNLLVVLHILCPLELILGHSAPSNRIFRHLRHALIGREGRGHGSGGGP